MAICDGQKMRCVVAIAAVAGMIAWHHAVREGPLLELALL
jgi:hypothetical protein